METPKIRIVLLDDELNPEHVNSVDDSAHLDAINQLLNELHGFEADPVYEEPEPDNVSVSIPDACALTGNEHFVHPDVAEYIARLEYEAKERQTLSYAIDRVLRSNYHVHISNK